METIKVKLNQIKINENNPRTITKEKLERLIDSILVFPKMMEIRPVVVDSNFVVLGGNQRTEALRKIAYMSVEKIKDRVLETSDFKKMSKEEQEALINFWKEWLKDKQVSIINGNTLTEDEKKQFIIKDNNSFGEWDFAQLQENWDTSSLAEWGLDFPDDWKPKKGNVKISETEKLSEVEYEGIYYIPKNAPKLKLKDCINLEKFNAKVKALDGYNLTPKQKETLKLFAYRFIKIDFEAVANYYAYNATEEEKKAMERLRLVLIDNGHQGFIEDDMLRILKSDINYINAEGE